MNKDYIYHAHTRTLCNKCENIIDGKIVYNDTGVYIFKNCKVCGEQFELLEEDTAYHLSKQKFDKQGTVSSCQTEFDKGCPFDCGLCPSHDQHTCIGLIEITKKCNLNCDMCYARAEGGKDLSISQIEKMIDFYIESENGNAEILQLSGGEPTLHNDIIDIVKLARKKGVKFVMINTNGIRIAEDLHFVEELSEFKGGFEIYLQFDGLNDTIYEKLRHKKLLDIKKKALDNLEKFKIPVTLVCSVSKDINDSFLGELLVYAMDRKNVRGVNFQPIAFYGKSNPNDSRITLSGVLSRIDKQTKGIIKISDFIPLPCNVERVAITYMFRDKRGFVPISRNTDLSEFKGYIGNTFMFTIEDTIKNFKEESTIFNMCPCCDFIKDVKKYLPKNFLLKSREEKIKFVDENTFRISVSSFIDKYNFDMKSMQKECVHIITPDLKRIPFSAYNMIHRVKYDV